jgi:hypothetical protein
MSAGAYINRIKVQSQARNTKVQYPGGKATNYNPLYATCASNPNFSILNYIPISAFCDRPVGSCFQPSSSCLPTAGEILDGGDSFVPENVTAICIFDGGFSSSNYTPVLSGGNSSP